jgi:hypothetical protein
MYIISLARQLDDRALQFERLKYGKLTNDERQHKFSELSQVELNENPQRMLVVTEANSRIDLSNNYPTNIEQVQVETPIKNDEVDELIEWTQCLPNTAESVEEN